MAEDIQPVRTRYDIKKNLLRRAMNGESQYTPSEMILLILWIQSRARDIPAAHERELDIIREVRREEDELRELLQSVGLSEDDIEPQSRTLLRLNAEERRRGLEGRWAKHGHMRKLLSAPSPSDSLN